MHVRASMPHPPSLQRCPPSLLAAPRCSVVIRPTTPATATPLALAEVQLYDAAGVVLPRTSLSLHQTSTLLGMAAGSCNDGSAGSACHTYSSGMGDALPTLRVRYPCARGASGLSRVVVTNRADNREWINGYTMDFLDASGAPDRPASYPFSGSLAAYTVAVPGEAVACR
jgi:hypothetical protein